MPQPTAITDLAAIDRTVNLEPDRIATYRQTEQTELQLHAFLPTDHAERHDWPAVVWFFGGGWVKGTITQFHRLSRHLASRGIISICADYRVTSRHQTTPADSVSDARAALRWLHDHAGDGWHIDPTRIAAGGGSAGGHLAAMTAAPDPETSATPAALVLFNPVLDTSPDGYANDRVGADWATLSPVHRDDTTWPATCVLLGTQDRVLPLATAERFRNQIDAQEQVCDLHIFGRLGHGFFNDLRFVETSQLASEFLIRHLARTGDHSP